MTPTEAPQPSVMRKMVLISKITADPGYQVRGQTFPDRVKEYTEIVKEQGFLDPLDIFYQDPIDAKTVYYVADGFHRLDAYKGAGVEKIPCNLRVGTKSEAIKFALKKNGHHGRPMTNLEKRHAAELSVIDPEIGNLTDKEIAGMIGCSISLISEARRGITKDVKKQKKVEREEKKATGKREVESPAPREATARERKVPENRPTKAVVLRQIEEHVKDSLIDEADLIAIGESKEGHYRFVPKPGGITKLKVIGSNGRAQVEVLVVVKEVNFDGIVLKLEAGKLSLVEGK